MKIQKIIRGDKIDYPITLNYRSNWGEWEAIREFVTNAIDSGGKVALSYNRVKEEMVISDTGCGMELHHLLIGEGEADGVKSIGKFHEGMKVAIVALLRIGCIIRIRSNGLLLSPEVAEMFGKDVLRIRYEHRSTSFDGTEIQILGIKKDHSKMFLTLSRKRGHRILFDRPGKLYIKGVFVRDIRSLFGYDLDTERANPNTGEPEWYSIHKIIGSLIANSRSHKIIKKIAQYLKDNNSWDGFAEFQWVGTIPSDYIRIWRHLFNKVFDERVGCYTDADSTRLIGYENKGHILSNAPRIVQSALPRDVDIKKIPKKHKKEPKIKSTDLCSDAKYNLGKVKRLFQKVFDVKIKVVVKNLDQCYLGRAKFQTYIWLSPTVLNDLEKCFGTFLHEFVHWEYGSEDLSQSFIHNMQHVSARICFYKKGRG